MDIRTPNIRTPYIGTPSIKAQSVGGMVTGKKTPPITYLLTDSENNILVDSEDYQLTVQS